MKKWLLIGVMLCVIGVITACQPQDKPTENVPPPIPENASVTPSLLSETVKEEPPSKKNDYGFKGDFLLSGNVEVFYPVTDHVKNETAAYPKGIPIETELQLNRPADWMLLENEDKSKSILIEIEQSRLKLLFYAKGAMMPARCDVDLGDGNFLNYAKIIGYVKNDILMIHSDYPSSAAYESIFLHYKNNELRLLENKNGDQMKDEMGVVSDYIQSNQTEMALNSLSRFEVTYPETYIHDLIQLNKRLFNHLSDKAKRLEATQRERAIEYYNIALSLVIMTEMDGNKEFHPPYLAYDLAMQLSESDPEIASELIETKTIAEVLNRYIQLLKKEKRPISDHLLELSKILNHNTK